MRLAIRDVRANRGRSALVVALVALPVAVVVGLYLFGTSSTWGDLQRPRESLGTLAAGYAEPATTSGPAGWADELPDGWRLVPSPVLTANVGEAGTAEEVSAAGMAGDFDDPAIRGLVRVSDGRLPATPAEVVVSPELAGIAGLELGDRWSPAIWGWRASGEQSVVPLTVVGLGELAGESGNEAFAVGGVPSGWAQRAEGADRVLIDSTSPITAEQIALAARHGVRVIGRDVPIEDPERLSLTLSEGLVVGLAVAFLQIVMLAGAAFAVSLRRRQRELALLSAAGAEPGDLTRAVLASGILLGSIGAVLGFALPWLVLVAGRPLLERLLGLPLATFPPIELAIVLVPIVGLLAALAASVVPARMAARIPLAKALRARDSANPRLHSAGAGVDGSSVRSALAGVALIVAGVGFVGFLMGYPSGSEDELGSGGWPIWALGLAVVLCEVGVVLLSPLVLALVAGRSRALPLAGRLAARDAARNRLRSSFAVAAVAVAVGLLAGCVTWLSSIQSAVQDAYRPAAAPGAAILASSSDQVQWDAMGAEDLAAVVAEFPQAQVALIGVGPTYDMRSGKSLAVRSQCDPRADLGVAEEALALMDPTSRVSLASRMAAGDPCRAPEPAGSPVVPMSVLGYPSWSRPGVVVADADAAALLLGREDPVVRAQLESGGAVALAPSAVVDGRVLIAADPQAIEGAGAGSTEFRPGPSSYIPAVVVDSPYAPAAVIVAPEALEARGLPVPRNAVLVVPPEPIPALQPWSNQLVSSAGLRVMSVEAGSPPTSMESGDWGRPVTVGPLVVGWRLIVGPLAFALLATILVTALALGDARPELATMAAVGASPGVRRRFAMWAAIVVAGVGSVLGALAGIAPAWAALRSADFIVDPANCLWSPVGQGPVEGPMIELGEVYCDVPLDVPLDVPWTWLAVVVVGVPVVAGLVFLIITRSRVVLPRR